MLKPYDGYKKTNIPWLTEIPNHWRMLRNKNVLFEQKELVGDNATDYTLLSLTLNGVIARDMESGKGKFPKEFNSYKIVNKDNIIFCLFDVDETPRTVGLSNLNGMITGAYDVFEVKNIDRHYLYYYYLSVDNAKDMKPLYTGLRKVIGVPKFLSTKLPVPPREEQDQIVKCLDWQTSKINTLIKAKEKQIELLKEQKQAIINTAVTKGLDDNVPMKDSGIEWLGEVPEYWTIKNLGSFASLQNGISESGDFFTQGFPFVNYGDVYNNYALPKEVDGLANSNKKQQEVYSIIKGDILFTRTSETKEDIARSCVAMCTIENAVFSGFVIRVRPISNTILTGYSKFYFRNELLRNYFVKEMNIVTRASLSQGVLRNLPVTLPSLEEQQAIVTYLEEKTTLIDKAIAVIEKEIELVSEYKTSLISSVVTGKLDVRDVAVPDFEVVEEVAADIENDDEGVEEKYE